MATVAGSRPARQHTLPARYREKRHLGGEIDYEDVPEGARTWGPGQARKKPKNQSRAARTSMNEIQGMLSTANLATGSTVAHAQPAQTLVPPAAPGEAAKLHASPAAAPPEEVGVCSIALLEELVSKESDEIGVSSDGTAHSTTELLEMMGVASGDLDESEATSIASSAMATGGLAPTSMWASADAAEVIASATGMSEFEELASPGLLGAHDYPSYPSYPSYASSLCSLEGSPSSSDETTEAEHTPPRVASPPAHRELQLSPPPLKPASVASGGAAGKGGGRNVAERKDWSAAEDELICRSVAQNGCRWRVIASMLPGRSDDAVRNRWNRLKESEAQQAGADGEGGAKPAPPRRSAPRATGEGKPERVSWSRAEDETIVCSVLEIGHKWGKIAARLPGRTEHAIRNRYSRLQSLDLTGQYAAAAAAAAAAVAPLLPVAEVVAQ